MKDVKRILVVSRSTRYCRKAVRYGVSLARKYGAELYVIHAVYDPFIFGGWNLPAPTLDQEYKKELEESRQELNHIIREETKEGGITIKELIREGKPTEAVLKTVKEEHIDLIVMLAHEEGRIEHFLFGRSNEEIIRKIPCSILLVKKEPEAVKFES
jgi:universal stress protein A